MSAKKSTVDWLQDGLDIVGFVPGIGDIADGINGIISLFRGDYVTAGLSFVSMIPLAGDAIGKGGKVAKHVIKNADNILDAAKIAEKGKKTVVLGENMTRVKKAAKILQKEGVDAKWYQAWSKNFPTMGKQMSKDELSKALKRNDKWLTSKLDEGYQIIDIGIDSARKGERSIFYQTEQHILENSKELNLIKVEIFNKYGYD